MRLLAPAIFALLSASTLLPLAASAVDSVGVVAVAEPPGPAPALAELTNQLRLALQEKARGNLVVLPAAELRERMTGQVPPATFTELDRAYASAVATFQKGDFEDAVRALRGIVQDLERLRDSPEAFSRRSRAILRLARSEQTLGRTRSAKEILERLVRVHPSVKVDKNEYPPSFRKLVDEVRASVTALGMRRLTVASALKAKVFVEGREAGSTPLTIDLPPGRYRLFAFAGPLRIPSFTVDLTEDGRTVTLGFALAESLRPALGPGLALQDSDRMDGLVAAASSFGVDKLVAAALVTQNRVEQLSATMIDARRGAVLREARIRVAGKTASTSALNALASFLATGQSSSLVAAATPAPSPSGKTSLEARPPSSADVDLRPATPTVARKTSSTLGWSAVGVAALGAGLGALAAHEGLSARSSYDEANTLLRPDGTLLIGASISRFKALRSDGDTARSVAFISGGAALGCAAVSGILGYLSYKQTGEIGPFRF